MDVFEHLVDPVETVEHLWEALKPGGFLYARIHAESDADRPQHIVHDFGPTLTRMQALGLVQVWQDEWLWGHQVFQKLCGLHTCTLEGSYERARSYRPEGAAVL